MKPRPSSLRPSFDGDTDLGYEPQDMEMHHDPFFAEIVPSVANSGNLAHKWGGEGDHIACEAPPADLEGD